MWQPLRNVSDTDAYSCVIDHRREELVFYGFDYSELAKARII